MRSLMLRWPRAGTAEASDLDWKSKLYPAKGLPPTDFPKDVAAMANSGGGVIVCGVLESQKAATGRVDAGELDEAHERSLCSVAVTAITPPVFGLTVHRLDSGGKRAVVIEVPASLDGPHLIYRDEYFGAPVRNGSDTVWMRERQIEAMYRARFSSDARSVTAIVIDRRAVPLIFPRGLTCAARRPIVSSCPVISSSCCSIAPSRT